MGDKPKQTDTAETSETKDIVRDYRRSLTTINSALAAPTNSPALSSGDFGNCNPSHNRGSSSERGGRRGGRGGRGGRGTKKCTHCGATNHDVEFCWKLHDKPAWANQATLEGEPSALAPIQITMSKTECKERVPG